MPRAVDYRAAAVGDRNRKGERMAVGEQLQDVTGHVATGRKPHLEKKDFFSLSSFSSAGFKRSSLLMAAP